MEILQSQVKLIQEAQETSLSAQVNLCDALLQHKSESDAGQLVATPAESQSTSGSRTTASDRSQPGSRTTATDRSQPGSRTTATDRSQPGSRTAATDRSQPGSRTTATDRSQPAPNDTPRLRSIFSGGEDSVYSVSSDGRDYDTSSDENDDLIRLAAIQNRPARYSHVVKSGRPVIPNKPRQSSDHYDQRTPSQRTRNGQRDIITGVGKNFHLRSSDGSTKQQPRRQCVGIFVSRLSKSTKTRDVQTHIDNETSLKVKCERIPPRYDNCTFTSFVVRVPARDQTKLLEPTLWPSGALIRGYYE